MTTPPPSHPVRSGLANEARTSVRPTDHTDVAFWDVSADIPLSLDRQDANVPRRAPVITFSKTGFIINPTIAYSRYLSNPELSQGCFR